MHATQQIIITTSFFSFDLATVLKVITLIAFIIKPLKFWNNDQTLGNHCGFISSMHPRESLAASRIGYDSLAGISRSSSSSRANLSTCVRVRVGICVCTCMRVSRSRPHHVTSNRKLGRDFQSRNESPFCLVHDGVAFTRERAKGEERSLIWRRGPSRYPRGESRGETKREREERVEKVRVDPARVKRDRVIQ